MQPARRGCRDLAGHAGDVVRVVVLQAHAVRARRHQCGVGRSLPGALLDDEPSLGPGDEAGARGRKPLTLARRAVVVDLRDHSRESTQTHGDAAVARQWLVHEVEAVGHGFAARAQGDERMGGNDRRAGRRLDGRLLVEGGEHRHQDDQQPGESERDHPAAHGAQLGQFGPQESGEAGVAGRQVGAERRRRGAHRDASSASAARNSTASRVSSM